MPHSTRKLCLSLAATVGLTASAMIYFNSGHDDIESNPDNHEPVTTAQRSNTNTIGPAVEEFNAPAQQCGPIERPFSQEKRQAEQEIFKTLKPLLAGVEISSWQNVTFDDQSNPEKVNFALDIENIDCKKARSVLETFQQQLELDDGSNPEYLEVLNALSNELFTKGEIEHSFSFNEQNFENTGMAIFPPDVIEKMKELYAKAKEKGVPDINASAFLGCHPETFGIGT